MTGEVSCDVCERRAKRLYHGGFFERNYHPRSKLYKLYEEYCWEYVCPRCARMLHTRFPPGTCFCGEPAVQTLPSGVISLCGNHLEEFVHRALEMGGMDVVEDNLDYGKEYDEWGRTDAAYYPDGFKAMVLRGPSFGEAEVVVRNRGAWAISRGWRGRGPLNEHISVPAVRFSERPVFVLRLKGETFTCKNIAQLPGLFTTLREEMVVAEMFPREARVLAELAAAEPQPEATLCRCYGRELAPRIVYTLSEEYRRQIGAPPPSGSRTTLRVYRGDEMFLVGDDAKLVTIPILIRGVGRVNGAWKEFKDFTLCLRDADFWFVAGRFGLLKPVVWATTDAEANTNGLWKDGLRLWAVKPAEKPSGPYAELTQFGVYPDGMRALFTVDVRGWEAVENFFSALLNTIYGDNPAWYPVVFEPQPLRNVTKEDVAGFARKLGELLLRETIEYRGRRPPSAAQGYSFQLA